MVLSSNGQLSDWEYAPVSGSTSTEKPEPASVEMATWDAWFAGSG